MKYDVLAIGDPTIDCFIRLKDASVNCDVRHEHCLLCVRFGDKVPYEFFEEVPAVGNAANASVACARLGLSSAFRGYVGPDAHGKLIIDTFAKEGVATDHIEAQEGKVTNYHYVLWYDSERTILIKHEHFNYSLPKLAETPQWIYLSSLGEGTEDFQHEIGRYVAAHPETKLAFQPGTFQMKLGTDALKDIYQESDIFFCNKQEAQLILKTDESDAKKLLESMRALGPKIAVITDGRNGSYIMTDEGVWQAPMYPDPEPPKERTGAGDAASSTTLAYIIRGLPPQEALLRGHINSAYVVQGIGAQKGLLTA
ncbi:MAG: carbohydrate kinase family protein [Patescibacteria group bacterium]|nr:carbohydrate kinase family protein [Patescibacteria group bacterium]